MSSKKTYTCKPIIYSLRYLPFFIIALVLTDCKPKKSKMDDAKATMASNTQIKTLDLLVGTYTDGDSKGIYKLDFDPETGVLSNKKLVAEKDSPDYLYLSKNRSMVYSANSSRPGSISVFKWNADGTLLNSINDYPSEGLSTCYITLNRPENLLAVANYSTGSITVYHVGKDGDITGNPKNIQHKGSGPHPNQKSAHAHCVRFDANGKYLYATDLGIDKIFSYPIDDQGKLGRQQVAFNTDPGDGPRHLIFHPTKNMAFVINELSSTIISLEVDHQTGTFTRIDKQSTLPADYDGKNACADIHLSADGKFLYGSNRGHNSIAIFSVTDDGHMKLLANEPVHGDWPRNFTQAPDGKYLLVANRRSNNITVFKIDRSTGLLTYSGNEIKLPEPVCLKF